MAYNEIFIRKGERWAKLGEHEWKLPKMPKKSDIWFSNLPKKDQHWKRPDDFVINPKFPNIFYDYVKDFTQLEASRTEYNDEGKLATLSYEDSLKLLELQEREMKRRWDGVWFMNNGDPTYITGSHYFQLTWCAVPDYTNPFFPKHPWKKNERNPYGDFRYFQMYLHYFLQMCKEDDECAGAAITKAKKTGVTLLLSYDILDESTKYKQKRFGFMSKSSSDAQMANFAYYEFALLKLPDIFLPNISNSTTTTYKFQAPKIKRTGTKGSAVKRMETEDGLDNEIFVAPSKLDAFDGPKMFRGILDEWLKYNGPYIKETFDATKETVKMGIYKIVGKLWLFSYAAEKDGRSFFEGKKIYEESALETKQGGKRTISGLYKYFVSALDSSEGTFDIYGNSDREQVRKDLHAMYAKVKNDPSAILALKRQYPIDEGDPWHEGGGGRAPFDNIRLGAQLDKLTSMEKTGQPDYEEGNLQWVRERKGLVTFVPLTLDERMSGMTGKFRFYDRQYLKTEMFNVPFLKKLKDGKGWYKPATDTLFVGSTDPVDLADKSDVSEGGASKNGITCRIMHDAGIDRLFGKPVTDRLIFDYLERPEDPYEYYEDLLMAMMYTGGYWWPEGNKPWVHKQLKIDEMQHFVLYRNTDTGLIEKFNPVLYGNKKQKVPQTQASSTGKSTAAEIVLSVGNHLRKPTEESPVDRIEWLKSDRVIRQLMRFDPSNTKKFDIAMAYGLNSLAVDAVLAWRMINNKRGDAGTGALGQLLSALIEI